MTTGRFASRYISVAITHYVAVFYINFPPLRGGEQHAGLGFAAGATGVLAVGTHADVIHRHARPELRMHGLYNSGIHQAIPDVGLIGNDDDEKTGVLEVTHGARGAGQQPEIFQPARRIGFAAAHLGAANHAIAIQKYRTPHGVMGKGKWEMGNGNPTPIPTFPLRGKE